MLHYLDILFTIIHVLLILFVLFGWIWKRLRRVHFILIVLIVLNWFVLGIWFGWGYCVITDVHWNIKEQLGESGLPDSFVKYAIDRMTRGDISDSLVDTLTMLSFVAAVVASVVANYFNNRKTNPAG